MNEVMNEVMIEALAQLPGLPSGPPGALAALGGGWLQGEFLAALARSPTAWREIGGRALPLLLALPLLVWLARRGLGRLQRHTGGSASAVGFMLVMPFVLLLAVSFAQLTMLLNKSLLVHYAAYSAARSARVWLWDIDPFDPRVRLAGRLYANPLTLTLERRERVRAQVEAAARFALIPAAPVTGPSSQGAGGAAPAAGLEALARTADVGGRAEVLIRQARYAFDPANTQVDFGLPIRPDLAVDLTRPGDAWPVWAEVEFRARLDLPWVRFLGTAGGDGAWYTNIRAEMVLL